MIYLILCVAVVCAGVCALCLFRYGKLEAMLVSLSLEVAHLKDDADDNATDIAHFENRIKAMEEAVEGIADNKLAETLEKKWEDAVQVISNFDPFRPGEDK